MKRWMLFAAASATCLAAATGAQAQGPVGDEIIITAEKVAQSVQKAPVSVTVLDAERIEEMGATSFADYAPGVPGLALQSLAPGKQRILLRGVSDGVDTSTRGATQNVTGVYIDDMVVSNNVTAPDLNLFDVDRIEVLKGPQGTLYGDGSVGGLLRIITKKASTGGFEAALEGTAAAIEEGGGEEALNAMVNVPIVADKLALRLVGQHRHSDGFIDDVQRGVDDVNTLDQSGLRASLRFEPSDTLSFTLNALFQETELGAANDYNVLLGDLNKGTIFAEPTDSKFAMYNGVVDWDLGWANLTSSTSHARVKNRSNGDFTDFLISALGLPLPSISYQGTVSETVTQELRLTSNTDQRLRWIAGLYYLDSEERGFEHDISVGLTDLFGIGGTPFDLGTDVIFSSFGTSERTEMAAFGEVSYDIFDKLTATAGARWFSSDISESETAGGIVTGAPVFSRAQSTEDDGAVFRFRLASQVTDDVLLFATAAEGYRVGGLNPINPFTIGDPTFPDSFDSDSLWSYELGWKSRWFDRRLTVNGALFYIDWSNIQIEVPSPSGFSAIGNAGAAEVKGVEFDIAYNPIDQLELGVAGSFVSAELAGNIPGDTTDGDPLNDFIGVSGDKLTGVPERQGSAYAQWRQPLPGGATGVLRADVQYVDETQRFYGETRRYLVASGATTDPNYFSYGDYTLVNLRAGVEFANDFTVTLFVKNVSDERAALFRGQQSTSASGLREDIYVAQPRTIGVTVSKSF